VSRRQRRLGRSDNRCQGRVYTSGCRSYPTLYGATMACRRRGHSKCLVRAWLALGLLHGACFCKEASGG